MIHRFVDLLSERPTGPDIPILGFDVAPLETRTIWKIGNGAAPVRMVQPIVSTVAANQPHLGDPHREPTAGAYVVYSRFNVSGTINRSVRKVDWDDTTDVELYADASGGASESLEPVWKPDGTKILFRAKGASSLTVIKHMDPDGTNVQTLFSGAGTVTTPLYSFDGSKIAWNEGGSLKVADADGTSVSTLATGVAVGFAWANTSLRLAYRQTVGTNEVWKVINSDGTGGATWLTISRTGYLPSEGNPTGIMFSWLADDSAFVTTVRQPADPNPDARLTLVDSTGSHLISPARYGASNNGTFDTRPVAITGRLEGVERLYWLDDLQSPVASVLPDGSDYRVDFDGTTVSPGGSHFHGFRGDTLNV